MFSCDTECLQAYAMSPGAGKPRKAIRIRAPCRLAERYSFIRKDCRACLADRPECEIDLHSRRRTSQPLQSCDLVRFPLPKSSRPCTSLHSRASGAGCRTGRRTGHWPSPRVAARRFALFRPSRSRLPSTCLLESRAERWQRRTEFSPSPHSPQGSGSAWAADGAETGRAQRVRKRKSLPR